MPIAPRTSARSLLQDEATLCARLLPLIAKEVERYHAQATSGEVDYCDAGSAREVRERLVLIAGFMLGYDTDGPDWREQVDRMLAERS